MSLQCPRCTFIASFRVTRPRTPRHNTPLLLRPAIVPTRRPLTTSLPLSRTGSSANIKRTDTAFDYKLQSKLQFNRALREGGHSSLTDDEVRQAVRKEDRRNNLEHPAGKVLFSDGSTVPAPPKPVKYAGVVHADQASTTSTRDRLNAEWAQREADHVAAFKAGGNVELVMERLIENVTWQTSTSEEVSTAQQQTFDGGDDGYEIDPENFATRKNDLTPGSLLEVRYADQSIPYLAVHLKNKTGNYSREAFLLTPQGSLQLAKADMSRFTLPGFINPAKIDELLERIQTTGRIPSDLVQDITKQVRDFRAKVQKVFPGMSARVNRLHESLADKDVGKTVSTVEIAKIVTENENPADEDVYAAHLALLARKDLFKIEEEFDETRWEVKSLENVSRMKWTEAVIRESIKDSESEGGKIITAFVEKARRVIDYGRKSRELRKAGKEMEEELDVVWDEQQMNLLKALQESLEYRRGQAMTLKSLFPHILSSVDRYSKDRLMNDMRLFEFLGEVGVHSPWEDTVLRESHLALGGHRTDDQAEIDHIRYGMVEKGEIGFEELGLEDKLKEHRHDWKDMMVYCIDDASTQDIDDGISFEKIPGSDDIWLHVHVANPTAFIPLDHWIGEVAKRKVESFYSPLRNYPMLPLRLSTEHFGLAPNRPALTFSILMDLKTGESKDFKIRPSIIRNVKRVTYELLDEVFLEENPTSLVLSNKPLGEQGERVKVDKRLGTLSESDAEPESLSKEDMENLQGLYDLGWKIRTVRGRGGGFESENYLQVDLRVNNGRGNEIHPGLQEKPILDVDEPTITMVVDRWNKKKANFSWRDVVREGMTAAGHCGAKWSADRNLVQLYRHHEFIWQNEAEEKKWYALKAKAENADGYTPDTFWSLFFPVGSSELSTEVGLHRALGLDGYVKVTSPLRRYSDFVSHHIIQKQLMAEAAAAAKGEPVGEVEPIMSEEKLVELSKHIREKERQMRSAADASVRLWAIRLVKDLWERQDPQIAQEVDVEIISIAQYPSLMSGEIKQLGLTGARVRFPANMHKQVKYGDVVKAKLANWHWSSDASCSTILAMDYVDYVSTMEDAKAKMFEDIGEGTRWMKDQV
ncbi:hypothetical protein H072_4391 [Dactylellina haptotyla CBS 200.50]|uniref:RNB domain-containing protein n=1 Tax=Dactylellina haptotyla (strain CBS 200.50) TaxID=1284197 RepID=S8AKR6_DACHA|nr:hypothetical protein H072_4391 [Dactylellina haptotyla CBS 200.50]